MATDSVKSIRGNTGVDTGEMVILIGETAGKVWRHLNAEGESTVPSLARALGEKSDRVAMAIGWLAREDKVTLTLKRNSTQVTLKSDTPTW